jgi:hypothetical protein
MTPGSTLGGRLAQIDGADLLICLACHEPSSQGFVKCQLHEPSEAMAMLFRSERNSILRKGTPTSSESP